MFGVKRKFRVVYLFILKKSEYKREVKNKKKKKKKKKNTSPKQSAHANARENTGKREKKHFSLLKSFKKKV